MKPRLEIRALRPDERHSWEPLWQGYLAFYESALTPQVTETTWRRLHDPVGPMHVLGAFLDGTLVGIVHYLFHRSTWTIGRSGRARRLADNSLSQPLRQLRSRCHVQLSERLAQVVFHGARADEELRGDLAVRVALGR
jgi:hypothetical protein